MHRLLCHSPHQSPTRKKLCYPSASQSVTISNAVAGGVCVSPIASSVPSCDYRTPVWYGRDPEEPSVDTENITNTKASAKLGQTSPFNSSTGAHAGSTTSIRRNPPRRLNTASTPLANTASPGSGVGTKPHTLSTTASGDAPESVKWVTMPTPKTPLIASSARAGSDRSKGVKLRNPAARAHTTSNQARLAPQAPSANRKTRAVAVELPSASGHTDVDEENLSPATRFRRSEGPCVLYSTIPLISRIFPVGHVAVMNSTRSLVYELRAWPLIPTQNAVWVLEGRNDISLPILFGRPVKALPLAVPREHWAAFDEALEEETQKWKYRMHKGPRSNCHTFICDVLNNTHKRVGGEGEPYVSVALGFNIITHGITLRKSHATTFWGAVKNEFDKAMQSCIESIVGLDRRHRKMVNETVTQFPLLNRLCFFFLTRDGRKKLADLAQTLEDRISEALESTFCYEDLFGADTDGDEVGQVGEVECTAMPRRPLRQTSAVASGAQPDSQSAMQSRSRTPSRPRHRHTGSLSWRAGQIPQALHPNLSNEAHETKATEHVNSLRVEEDDQPTSLGAAALNTIWSALAKVRSLWRRVPEPGQSPSPDRYLSESQQPTIRVRRVVARTAEEQKDTQAPVGMLNEEDVLSTALGLETIEIHEASEQGRAEIDISSSETEWAKLRRPRNVPATPAAASARLQQYLPLPNPEDLTLRQLVLLLTSKRIETLRTYRQSHMYQPKTAAQIKGRTAPQKTLYAKTFEEMKQISKLTIPEVLTASSSEALRGESNLPSEPATMPHARVLEKIHRYSSSVKLNLTKDVNTVD